MAGGYYRPYFYDPWFYPFGLYGWYPPYAYAPAYPPDSSLRLQVSPKETEVFVDGYYAGTVDDFDGMFQRLHLERGEHEVAVTPGAPHRTPDDLPAALEGRSESGTPWKRCPRDPRRNLGPCRHGRRAVKPGRRSRRSHDSERRHATTSVCRCLRAGFGSATLPVVRSVAVPFADRNVRFGARGPVAPAPGAVQTFRFGVGDDFLVLEPQGVVKYDVVNHMTINGGIRYRAVALTDVLRDRVDGATASLGLEFDW